jgi:hypothetical protein
VTSSQSSIFPACRQIPEEAWGIPSIGISGYSGFGDNTEGPYTNRNKVFEFTDNLSWIHGEHSFKVGAAIRFDHYNQVGNQFARGAFTFDGRATGSATGAATSGGAAFADFLLGYMRTSEVAVALARTEFRAASQSYYFTDTWRFRDDMTLDLGLRYEYVPPWLDQGGTLMNAYLPYRDTGMPVTDLSRHPVLVRIGEGDFYEDSPIRFAPNIATSRGGQLGGRLINDDKLNFAPRVGYAWTPSDNWSIRAGAGVFYMQDTGNPRFDMARNAAGRRQDTADPLRLNLNWTAPFAGSGTNACGVHRRWCVSRTTMSLATSSTARRRTWCSTCSTSSASSIGPRRSKSAISDRGASGSNGCSMPTRSRRGQAASRTGVPIRSSPRSRRSATSPRPSTTRWPPNSHDG